MKILGKEYKVKPHIPMMEEQDLLVRLNQLELDVRTFQTPDAKGKKDFDSLSKEWDEICAAIFESQDGVPKLAALNMGGVRRVGADFFLRDLIMQPSAPSEETSPD